MTRKTAIQQALRLLETSDATQEVDEIMSTLRELAADLPITQWDEKTIFDTLDQFVMDNHRQPTFNDLKKKSMPPHTVIKHRFGMTAAEFLRKHYPRGSSSPYKYKTPEEWREIFREEFQRQGNPSAVTYDKNRPKDCPTWKTLARMFEIERWSEWLEHCGLVTSRKDDSWENIAEKDFMVTIRSSFGERVFKKSELSALIAANR